VSRRYLLEREQTIRRSLEDVFAFFSDAGNLEAITPPFLRFRILTPRPIAMHEGALIEYRLRLFGAPIFWRTRIDVYEPPHRFVDMQIQGPYRLWRHEHTFEPVAGGVRMVDRVDYELPLAPLGPLAHGLFVGRMLARIFDYRRDRVADLLGKV
jgi:ligand-binding SRPBCC domain-containing protein